MEENNAEIKENEESVTSKATMPIENAEDSEATAIQNKMESDLIKSEENSEVAFEQRTTEETLKENKKISSRSKKWIAGLLTGLIIIAVAVIYFVSQTAWAMERKVGSALKNTFPIDKISSINDLSAIFQDGTSSLSADLATSDMSIHMDYSIDNPSCQYYLYGVINYNNIQLSLETALDDKEAKIRIPELTDKTLVYNYVDEKTGYIVDILESLGTSTKALDETFSMITTGQYKDDQGSELAEDIEELECDYEVTKAEELECMVNGKSQMCKGYTFLIKEEDYLAIYKTYMSAYLSKMENYTSDELAIDELFSETPGDLNATFYLYKNEIVKILVAFDKISVDLELLGGSEPTENMKMTVHGEEQDTVLEKKGEVSGTVLSSAYYLDDEKILTTEYDKSDKSFSAAIYSENALAASLDGTWDMTENDLTINLENITLADSDIAASFSLSLNGDSFVKEMPSDAEIFDLDKASEEDWNVLYEEIMTFIMQSVSY